MEEIDLTKFEIVKKAAENFQRDKNNKENFKKNIPMATKLEEADLLKKDYSKNIYGLYLQASLLNHYISGITSFRMERLKAEEDKIKEMEENKIEIAQIEIAKAKLNEKYKVEEECKNNPKKKTDEMEKEGREIYPYFQKIVKDYLTYIYDHEIPKGKQIDSEMLKEQIQRKIAETKDDKEKADIAATTLFISDILGSRFGQNLGALAKDVFDKTKPESTIDLGDESSISFQDFNNVAVELLNAPTTQKGVFNNDKLKESALNHYNDLDLIPLRNNIQKRVNEIHTATIKLGTQLTQLQKQLQTTGAELQNKMNPILAQYQKDMIDIQQRDPDTYGENLQKDKEKLDKMIEEHKDDKSNERVCKTRIHSIQVFQLFTTAPNEPSGYNTTLYNQLETTSNKINTEEQYQDKDKPSAEIITNGWVKNYLEKCPAHDKSAR